MFRCAAFRDFLVLDKKAITQCNANSTADFCAINDAELGSRRRSYAAKLLPITKLGLSMRLSLKVFAWCLVAISPTIAVVAGQHFGLLTLDPYSTADGLAFGYIQIAFLLPPIIFMWNAYSSNPEKYAFPLIAIRSVDLVLIVLFALILLGSWWQRLFS